MIPRILTMIAFAKLDVSDEMYIAIQNQKMGKIPEAQKFYDTNYHQYSKAEAFFTKHIEFLLWIGDYDSILKKYGHLNIPLITKTKECISIINSRDYRKISKLIDISPFSSVVIKACIKAALIDKNFTNVFNLINKGKNYWADDNDFLRYEAQYFCINGNYEIGAEKLEDLGFYKLANELKKAFEKFNELSKLNNNKQKYNQLRELYNKVNMNTFSDNFSPSIFSKLLDEILYKYVSLGITLELSDMVSSAKILYKNRNDEESRYFYIMSLLNSKQTESANNLLNNKKFSNQQYELRIKNKLEKIEEEKKQEKKRKQEQERQRKQRYVPSTNKAGTDFLGYYKLIGVNKNMDQKQIKKTYVKLIAKNERAAKTEKQKEEWEEKHAKINKAYQVLSNANKKEMYDKGVDPDSPEAQQGAHYQHHEQQEFKGFDDFGPFAEFFGGFGGHRGPFRQSRRTQYFYYN
ncbi:DnaJ subfamily C member [Vairimorpha necatrix]|uniref:DnaJ subfamily C member n=1 Tax=Vairimorpha necatrix TaxID=6039 RepID=A0AAX4JA30_9MICR